MGENRIMAIAGFAVLWVLVRPDMWAWALGFAVITIIMLTKAQNAGVKQGLETAMRAQSVQQENEEPDESSIAQNRLEAIEAVLAEADLFAYELNQGLVPDGNSRDNPGLGPMDFHEWREWKQREYERTGNPWHNLPDGLPPKEDDRS